MKKKRKKSLVGWTVEQWDLSKIRGQIYYPWVFSKKTDTHEPVKVKITIEEL